LPVTISLSLSLFVQGLPSCNAERYGVDTPPTYDFTAIETPLLVMSGSADQLADPQDAESLLAVLGSAAADVSHTQVRGFEHLDFIWADTADKRAYGRVIEYLASASV
jgi:lysosomal acid lipase/cholesteryl ester hydrolase